MLDLDKLKFKVDTDIDLVGLSCIDISLLKGYFSKDNLDKLAALGIHDLGTLIAFSQTPDYISSFDVQDAIEIMGNVTVLKCKYQNIDPIIDLSDPDMLVDEVGFLLGFNRENRALLKKLNIITLKDLDNYLADNIISLPGGYEVESSSVLSPEMYEIVEKMKTVREFNARKNENNEAYLKDQIEKLEKEKNSLNNMVENYKENTWNKVI